MLSVTQWTGCPQITVSVAVFTSSFYSVLPPATVMIPAYSLNRAYSIFFVSFSVIGRKSFLTLTGLKLYIITVSEYICFTSCRYLLSDELIDSYNLQPVQRIFTGEFLLNALTKTNNKFWFDKNFTSWSLFLPVRACPHAKVVAMSCLTTTVKDIQPTTTLSCTLEPPRWLTAAPLSLRPETREKLWLDETHMDWCAKASTPSVGLSCVLRDNHRAHSVVWCLANRSTSWTRARSVLHINRIHCL